MAESQYTLEAKKRTLTGKGFMRQLRREKRVPGVFYHKLETLPLEMDLKEASALVTELHGSERLIQLNIAGEWTRMAILKEIQSTAVGNRLLHVDLMGVDVAEELVVTVGIQTVGTPEGAKFGGVLQTVRHDLQVRCLPTLIPEVIEIDVSALNVGDSIHVGDVQFPEGVVSVTPNDETLIVISAVMGEEEEEEEKAADAVPSGAGAEAEKEKEE